MKTLCLRLVFLGLLTLAGGVPAAQMTHFTPQDDAAEVSQVTANFDAPVRALGDLSGPDPLRWHCDRGIAGKARWVDVRTWAVDFSSRLPAGVSCEFVPVAGLKDVAGQPLKMNARYRFNTGGPMARSVTTAHGWRGIDEEAVFIVRATGELDFSTIEAHAWCEVEGLGEKIPLRLLPPADKIAVLEASGESLTPANAQTIAALRCARRLPNGGKVFLNWGAGIRGSSGLATSKATRHEFRVREEFSVKVSCPRENAKAGCNPFGNIPLRFTAPVLREDAAQLRLVGPTGRQWEPALLSWEEGEGGGGDSEVVDQVQFNGPFPPEAKFQLRVPAQLRDDAGRPLANRDRLAAVTLETAAYPPLLKFAADFGIVERKAGGLLPVTLRNLDPLPADSGLKTVDNSRPGTSAKVRLLRLSSDEDYFAWRRRAAGFQSYDSRGKSYLKGEGAARTLLLPKPNGAKAMEVVGIPLGEPGYHIVEAESEVLGRSLLDKAQPMFVRTEALNTNLAVHFKKGEENQLVWVTALDTGKPVAEARISVRDCSGKQIAFGKTGADGTMAIKRRLPPNPQRCESGVWGYYVSARSTQQGVEDFSFVLSHWQNGIESWRYQLPYAGMVPDVMLHTVFDRPLFRAGETVHMKHLARRHLTGGFGWVPREQLPDRAVIQLEGSELRYELPLSWKGGSAESVWTIPAEARLGRYWISFAKSGDRVERVYGGDSDGDADGEGWWPPTRFWRGGSFRVAEFRLPVLKGEAAFRQASVEGEQSAEVDLKLAYLAGGAASGEKIRLRSELTPLYLDAASISETYAGYAFASPPVDDEAIKGGHWYGRAYDAVVFDDQRDLPLDAAGTRRATVSNIPPAEVPSLLRSEMEYSDPSGEIHTAAATTRWFPAAVLAGVRAEGSWSADGKGAAQPGRVAVLTLDTGFKPLAAVPFEVRAWQIKTRVHRKRLIGGLYSYDQQQETVALGELCRGSSDAQGRAECGLPLPVREKGVQSVQLVVEVKARDGAQRPSHANTTLWLSDAGGDGDDRWYEQGDSDRIDLTPERKKYQPGETAVFTVKMPFRQATALVSVEREGIIDRFVATLSGAQPTVRVPIKPHYGPNVFVSVLAVRGRIGDVQPTALVDLGKPAYKLGIAEIEVGRQGYELKVEVLPEQPVYKTREEATVRVRVTRPDGTPAGGGEFALAAVDEALLELAPNHSWQLLSRLMARRGYGVETSTAQTQVIGKRHFGLKAVPAGGGGGRQPTRELFDTLIKWQARVTLDDKGEALVKLPLNDSLTRIRVVAVAHQGAALFGTGMASFRTSKDVQVFSGLPPVVRDGDRFRAGFTVRNLSGEDRQLTVEATVTAQSGGKLPALAVQSFALAAGAAREVAWPLSVPAESTQLVWQIKAEARATGADGSATSAQDALKVTQKVLPALPVKVLAATLEQVDGRLTIPVQRPVDALPGRGSVEAFLKARLGASTDGVLAWMSAYPYICLEQKLSKALATGNLMQWQQVQALLPSYLDNNGLASYFRNPRPNSGSPTLTAYLLSASHAAGYAVPDEAREAMLRGLTLFIQGRIVPDQAYWSPREDLPVRKLKALEALARHGRASPELLAAIPLTPGVWPTSGVVSWLNILLHTPNLASRATLLAEAEQHLRSRLVRSGTLTQFSRESEDYWWWLMDSPDGTAARAILALMELPGWQGEIPRLVRGVLSRQREGHWDTTLANVWGVILLDKFGRKYESAAVQGVTELNLDGVSQRHDWSAASEAMPAAAGSVALPAGGAAAVAWRDSGTRLRFDWPVTGKGTLSVVQQGGGKPWLTVQTRAARALKAPVYAGFEVQKKITPVEQKQKGRWSRGDVVEVELTVSAPTAWTWVVIDDPVPAGATILGSGLGGESVIAGRHGGGEYSGYQLAHTERAFDAYRSYYERFHGSARHPHRLSYRLRLNNAGEFVLPPTRVEAMYAPEKFGELPNAAWSVAE